jgi:hypothetical protein
MEEITKIRTDKQHKALMVLEKELADEMVKIGLDMRTFLKEGVEIPATKQIVHDHIVKPLVKAMFKKDSTTQLEVHEVNQLYEVINRHLGEKTGIHVDFPSVDNSELLNN